MTTPKIDLSHLAAFITACDSISMSRAADAIGLTTSAFSARLHGLETRLGLKLFARHGRNMWPLPSAVWLYNRSVRLLLAEEFLRLRLRVRSGAEETIRSVIIQLDEAYTGTYMALAVRTRSDACIPSSRIAFSILFRRVIRLLSHAPTSSL